MILLFYAFGMELRPFRRRLEHRRPLGLDGLTGFRSHIGNLELVAIATGIGPRHAGQSARRAFKALPHAALVITAGVAGALSPGLAVGDVVVADRLITARVDEVGIAPERVVTVAAERVEELGAILLEAGLAVSTGGVLTTSRVLATAADKRQAREASGAIAVDMESASIAAEAASEGLPLVCLRTVMDAADEDLLAAGFTSPEGHVNALRAVRTIVTTPGAILQLPQMMHNLSIAARSLATALDAVIHAAT
jgi:adenosylhomocysteine nucleosidase